ncbi:MAG TPA: DNA polymerase III subunit delta' C-terminal domain-containing protein [Clostridia bacterium]|nr:DNA polymerase III subunit delta' C-terminal domain-containing protein [Clostridia bacterium]
MNTNNIIGQFTLINGLRAMVDSGRIVHSYIFIGPEGVGKKTISGFFAKMLLCTGVEKPCNRCKSCLQFDSDNQPDLIRVKSDKGIIRVDAIRDVRRDIGIKPFQGLRKIYIIEDGETMNQYAQNAFLKTLEEPPKHAVIMILASNLTSLFPTIVSRCQQIRVPGLSTKEVTRIIERKAQMPREEALVYGKLSQGIPGMGLKLAGSDEYRQLREESLAILNKLANSSLVESMAYIDYFLDNRDNITEILDIIGLWLRDVLILKQDGCKGVIINSDKLSKLEPLAKNFTIPAIQDIIGNIEDSKMMLRSHANFQLTIENMLMKIQGSGKHAGGSRSTV